MVNGEEKESLLNVSIVTPQSQTRQNCSRGVLMQKIDFLI